MGFVTGLRIAVKTPVPETTVELVQSVGVGVVAVGVVGTASVTDRVFADVAHVL